MSAVEQTTPHLAPEKHHPRSMRQSRGAPSHATTITSIKVIHSAIFLVESASILHIFLAGVFNRPSRWTPLALILALSESIIFVANRGRCPLTDLTEQMGAENGRVSDIFLPVWFADRIPQIFTPPLVIGVLGLAVHRWRRPH